MWGQGPGDEGGPRRVGGVPANWGRVWVSGGQGLEVGGAPQAMPCLASSLLSHFPPCRLKLSPSPSSRVTISQATSSSSSSGVGMSVGRGRGKRRRLETEDTQGSRSSASGSGMGVGSGSHLAQQAPVTVVVSIDEVDLEGRFVRLKNSSDKVSEGLGG